MASKDLEEPNTETEEETLAIRKKRARRVSFADIEVTSVHVFNRDDEFENQSNPLPVPVLPADDEVVGFFRDLADSDDSRESSLNFEDDGEVVDKRKSFFRPIGSPSPRSSTHGSATSIDGRFIRPGRLSDSAASEDNHDITMDSTAFSMHFHSLARSDGGDLKTPTAFLSLEEKTHTQNNTPDNPESFMVLTKAKKLILQPLKPVDVVSGGKDSNDMSIVGDNPYKFDYARLSPTLDALLTEGSKDLHSISFTEKSYIASESLIIHPIEGRDIDDKVSGNTKMENGRTISTKDTMKVNKQNLDVNAINHDTSPNVNAKILHSDVLLLENLSNGKEENSPKVRFYESDNLMQGSMLSSSVWQANYFSTPNSNPHAGTVTPVSKHKSPSISNAIMTYREGVSPTQKSTSKFRIPERSPCASSVKEVNEKLRSRLSSYSSMQNFTVPLDTSKDIQWKAMDVPIAHLEEQLFTSDTINAGHECVIGTDKKETETPKFVGRLREIEEAGDFLQVGKASHYTSLDIPLKEKHATLVNPSASPSQLSVSKKQKMMQHSMDFEYQTGDRLATPGTSTLLMDTRRSSRKYENSMNLYDRISLSAVKSLGKMFSLSAEYQGSLYGESNIWDKHTKSADDTSCQDGEDAPENASGPNSTPNFKPSQVKDFGQRENDGGNYYPNSASKAENDENFHTEIDIWSSHLESADKSLKVGIVQQRCLPNSLTSIERFPQKSSSKVKSILSPIRTLTLSPLTKKAVEDFNLKNVAPINFKRNPIQDSTREELTQTLRKKDAIDAPTCTFVEPLAGRGTSSLNMSGQNHGNSHSFLSHVVENLSAKKRSSSDLVSLDQECNAVEKMIERNPKVHKTGRIDSVSVHDQTNEMYNMLEKSGEEAALKEMPDISVKILAYTRDPLPPLINELNMQAIEKLEDTLIQLSNVKKYEILRHEILSQKIDENLSSRHKRTMEVSLLAWKIAYEKAKVQLSCLKRERYLKIGQLLNSQIWDSKTLHLKYSQFSQFHFRDAQFQNRSMQSCLVNTEGNPEDKVSNRENTMTQRFMRLNREIVRLRKYFSTYCKLKGESSSTDTITLVRDHLQHRQLCKFVSQDLQLWNLDGFERKDGHFNVVLNYLDYVTQSFTIKIGPVSSVVISYKLNITDIVKSFPNMNAQSAFECVVNVGSVRTCVGSGCISKETQQIGFLLQNLLCVIEELQLAQTDITNLIQTSFYSPSDEYLDLNICFIDFSSGEKVTLSLDVSYLNRGVYPSDVIPHKIEAPPQSKYTLLDSFVADIKREVESLRVGFSRILRLCRCVSHVMQASSR